MVDWKRSRELHYLTMDEETREFYTVRQDADGVYMHDGDGRPIREGKYLPTVFAGSSAEECYGKAPFDKVPNTNFGAMACGPPVPSHDVRPALSPLTHRVRPPRPTRSTP
jgi:hypothetical protein